MAHFTSQKAARQQMLLTRCTVPALCPNPASNRCSQCGRRFCLPCAQGRASEYGLRCPCCGGSWKLVAQVY